MREILPFIAVSRLRLRITFPTTRLALPEGAILAVVDRNGTRILYRPESPANPIGSPIQPRAWHAMQTGADVDSFILEGSDGVRRYYAYRRLMLPGGSEPHSYIVAGFPDHLASAPARRIVARNLLFMVAVLAAAVAVALLLGEVVFARGFRVLQKTAGAISRGHLDARTHLPATRSDIGVLAAAVDRMAASLQLRDRETREERSRVEESLRDKEVLLREIHHRVKNNMQLILSLVSLQCGTDRKPEELQQTLETRIGSMALVHEIMYQSPDVAAVPMGPFLQQLGELAMHSALPYSSVPHIVTDCCDVMIPIEQAVPLALIVSEAITNACKYGADTSGEVRIETRVQRGDGSIMVTVRDHGAGISPEESPPLESRRGIGVELMQALCAQLHGVLDMAPAQGGGTAVQVRFPESPEE